MKYFAVVLVETVSWLVFMLPRFRVFNFLKSLYLKVLFGASVGRRVVYYPGVWIFSGRNLSIGDDVDLAKGVLITTDGGVEIGDRVLIGYSSKIISRNHVVPDWPGKVFNSGHVGKKVILGDDTWIGANCVILPGVNIGEGCVVAAGAVVTKSFPSGSIIAGVPARVIGARGVGEI